MSQQLFVISDLHLGGGDGFQMVRADGRKRLAAFVRGVTDLHRSGNTAHLVLNGDLVDFLAEAPFQSFTMDDAEATRKLDSIFAGTAEFWDALARHLQTGAPLTMLLGNHDIELSLPATRRRLLERLGPGRIDFLYDNQALTIGPVLIEHGNRYDGWNLVNHDQLRQIRSALSRREPPPPFHVQPGSEMVVKIMNPLKAKYSFIDLLKPEDSAVPPLLTVLEPKVLTDLRRLYELARLGAESRQKYTDEEGLRAGLEATKHAKGLSEQIISVFSHVGHELHMHELAAALARTAIDDNDELAADRSDDEIQRGLPPDDDRALDEAVDFAALWRAARGGKERRRAMLERLRKALLARAGDDAQAFRIDYESPTYLIPARDLGRRGFRTAVFGHTHLVRRVDLDGGMGGGGVRYLNTGTWADLMRLPDALLRPDTKEADALEQLGAFADDLAQNRLDGWRRQRPTFARIDLTSGLELLAADVYLYREGGPEPGGGEKLPDGVLQF